jgi:hypothetical protein
MFTKDNIVALCVKVLRNMREWPYVVERELGEGKTLELAWRWKTNLDWIWMDTNGDNAKTRRDWNVLCGLALKQVG